MEQSRNEIAARKRSNKLLESSPGTIVPATAVWRGVGTLEDAHTTTFPPENIGILGGTDRSYIPILAGKLAMEAVPCTPQQLPYILAAGVKNVVTGSSDGLGTDKIYTYAFPTTAKNTIKTYTLEGGDDQQAEVMQYSFVEDFTIEGTAGEALMMSANWVGREVEPQAFTGSLSIPSVDDLLFSKGKLFIDAIGGTVGTTQKSQTFRKMTFKAKTGWVAVPAGDGIVSTVTGMPLFSFHKYTSHDITCVVEFEYDGTATAEIVNWRAQTPRLIQCRFDGAAVATPGTAYSKNAVLINMAGKWSAFSKIGDANGNDICTGTFAVKYDTTAATNCTVICVNELSTLP